MAVEVGALVTGKVVRIMPFGAFVQIEGGTTGLVHISEIARNYVEHIEDHVNVGDSVSAVVVKVEDNGKISLSIKKALNMRSREPKSKEPVRPADIDWGKKEDNNTSFEDKLSRFKAESDEAMAAIRRSADSKRSGGYRRGSGRG